VWLVAEGLSRANTTFAALGVLLVIVALMSSTAGAWRVTGPGFSVDRTSSAQGAGEQVSPSTVQQLAREAADAAVAAERGPPRALQGPAAGPVNYGTDQDVDQEVLDGLDEDLQRRATGNDAGAND
jgi:hypothetical protein